MSIIKIIHQKSIIFIVYFVYFAYNCGFVLTLDLECVPIKECPEVLNLISTKKYAPETIQQLRTSHCGYDENRLPKVWCGAPNYNICKTPDNQNGTCIQLNDCKCYQDLKSILGPLHPVVKDFPKSFRCNQVEREVLHVCCPIEQIPNTWINKNSDLNWNNKDKEFDGDNDRENELDNDEPIRGWGQLFGNSASPNDPYPEYPDNEYINRHINIYDNKNNGHNFHSSIPNEDFNDYNLHHNYHNNFFGHKYHPKPNWRNNIPFNRGWHNNDEFSTNNNDKDYTTEGSGRDFLHNRQNPEVSSTTINPTPKTAPRDFEQSTATTTTKSTTVNSISRNDNNDVCETPDRKTGICKNQNNCKSYQNLLNNLDTSTETSREYLSKFKCTSNSSTQESQVCCEADGDKDVNDNSGFNFETTFKNETEVYSQICGRQTLNTDKIYGGKIANLGEFPWIAMLEYQGSKGSRFGCGGTLINSRYVLTAAHCVDAQILKQRQLGELKRVILGEYDTRNKTDCIYYSNGENCADPAKTYGIDSIISHNLYNSSMTRHDIALIRLDQEVVFTAYIRPICLPTNVTSLKGNERFIIAGWGKTPTQATSPVLKKAKIRYAKKEDCNSRNRRSLPLIEGQICAGQGNGTDSCNGDSGGPVMLEAYNFGFVTYIIGIISYGFGNCGFSPSVNTYVPFYMNWINENTK